MRHLFAWAALALVAAAAVPAADLELQQVADSVWMVKPARGSDIAVSNAGFVILPDRVLLFDTLSNEQLMREMLELIATVTKLPVAMVAVSHWHPDHAGGLAFYGRNDYTLLATKETAGGIDDRRRSMLLNLDKRERDLQRELDRATDSETATIPQKRLNQLRQQKLRLQALPPTSIDVEVTSSTELVLGGRTYFLQHPGPGHTDGDMMLYAVDEKVLLAGDLLSVDTLPNLANAYSSVWIERLREIEQMNIEFIIPGHGPLGTKEDVRALRAYLESLRELVRPIVADGGTSRDLVEKLRVPTAFSSWSSEELWFPATLRVFHELQGNVSPSSSR